MGISAAMSTKERRQILEGLIDQGAVVAREAKRGTILNLKDGARFIVPLGTSDYKARLAMRATVKRLGYHWPLDPPPEDPKKKEHADVAAADQTPDEETPPFLNPSNVDLTNVPHHLPKAEVNRTPLDINAAREAKKQQQRADIITVIPTFVPPADSDEDVELSLAAEQETRAIRAERKVGVVQNQLDDERTKHAATRRDLLVRIAGKDRDILTKDTEIERLRSLLEEARLQQNEGPQTYAAGSPVHRAHVAEMRVRELEDHVDELTDQLNDATERMQELRQQQTTTPTTPTTTPTQSDDGWWPLEPNPGQTIAETMNGATLFGLEVRIQARRNHS